MLDDLKDKVDRVFGKGKREYVAHQEKAESDIAADPSVAGSRADGDGEDGSYVGRTSPQFDAEVEQSGAEARTEAARRSHDKP